MAITIDGSANTIAGLAVGGVPDGTIDADALATNAVTNAKVASNAIDSSELVAGAVDLSHLSTTGTAGSGNYLRGDNSWQEAGGGILLQVKDTYESDEVLVSTHATWTDLDTSVTITPTDATTKMVIWARVGGIWKNSSTNWIGVRLLGTATSMTDYNKTLEMHYGYYTSSGGNSPVGGWMGPVSTAVVHDHNQTNAITYKLQAIVYDHSDDEATFMMWGNDNNNSNATIIVQEFST